MSLALGNARMEGSGLCRGMNCISVVYLPDPTEDGATSTMLAVADDHPSKAQVHTAVSSSSSSSTATSSNSSIGRNSDSGVGSVSSDPDDSGEPEVQSSYRGPLDTMDSLEDSLPMRYGLSLSLLHRVGSGSALLPAVFSLVYLVRVSWVFLCFDLRRFQDGHIEVLCREIQIIHEPI